MADDVVGGLGLGGEDSPWAHDVPASPAPPLPDAWTRVEPPPDPTADDDRAWRTPAPDAPPTDGIRLDAPADGEADVEPTDTPAARRRRPAVVVGAVALVGLAALATSMVLGGNDESGDTGTAEPIRTTVATTQPTLEETPTTRAPARETPRTANGRSGSASGRGAETSESLPEPERVWENTPITLNPRLQSMTVPTQIVVLNSEGILHVIDVPAGSLRSIDTRVDPTNLAVVVGDQAIAVMSYNGGDVTLLNMDGAVYDVEVPGGAGQVVARPGTNDFVVSPSNWSGNEPPPNILLAADGSMTEVSSGPLEEYGVWGVQYLQATGEAVVIDSGGTYAIAADGAARRLSTGNLVAVGRNHILVRECDEVLTCQYVRIGEDRQVVSAPDLDEYRGYDASMSLSPDGTLMTYFDWISTPLARRLLDFESGTSTVVDSIDQYGNNAAWAGDSSGLFIIDARKLVLHDRTTGERSEVAPGVDLGAIVAVAARPLAG